MAQGNRFEAKLKGKSEAKQEGRDFSYSNSNSDCLGSMEQAEQDAVLQTLRHDALRTLEDKVDRERARTDRAVSQGLYETVF